MLLLAAVWTLFMTAQNVSEVKIFVGKLLLNS